MNKMNKTGLMTAVAIAVAAMAPQMAVAAQGKKAVKSEASAPTVQSALERRLAAMEQELNALRAEVSRTRAETKAEVKATSAKVDAHEQKVETQLADESRHEKTHHDLLFFRGGFAHMTHQRHDELLTSNTILNGAGVANENNAGNGWYVGAGFDHRLTDDLWGLSDIAAVDGEVMFEYKNFGVTNNTLVTAAGNVLQVAGRPAGTTLGLGVIKNQVTQFTLTASPKIKFNQFGDFRPWIIPFGLGIHVISPPSSGVTVLNPGLMIGTGAEYRIWQDLYAGVDFRYHFTGGDLSYRSNNGVLNKTSTDGLTAGGYLGFGF